MMICLVINLFLFATKILGQNQDFSADNETVALLPPILHMGIARAKILHDINAARLRHHLPLRKNYLLLQETPEFLREGAENITNGTREILDNAESGIKDILGFNNGSDSDGSDETFAKGPPEDDTSNSLHINEAFHHATEFLIPKCRVDPRNCSCKTNNDGHHSFEGFPKTQGEECLEVPTSTNTSDRSKIEKTRNDENVKRSIESFPGNDMIYTKDGVPQEHVISNDQIVMGSENVEIPMGRDENSEDFSRHGKGLHTHHFSLTHGVEHHHLKPFGDHFIVKPSPGHTFHHQNHNFHGHQQVFPPPHYYGHKKVFPSPHDYDHKKVFPSPHDYGNQKVFPPPQSYGHQKTFTSQTTINKQIHHASFDQQHLDPRSSNDENVGQSFIIQAPSRTYMNHELFKRSLPLLKLVADPNVKLDMPKTIENIGTVAKNSFEDEKAPMFHIRNMVGSAKNVILAALRIPPQDAVIPTQYKVMDRSDLKKNTSPEIASRFSDVRDELIQDEDKFIQTFKRIGLMLRESIKSGQETLQHMTDVAHSARKAVVTTGHATPRFLTPYVKATAIKKDKDPEKLMLIAPRIGEVTDLETQPDPTDDYVKIGDMMDAFGVSNPEKNKVGLTRFVMHPKRINKIQSRFGGEPAIKTKKDFFVVAEHIDNSDDSEETPKSTKKINDMKSLKDVLKNVYEEISKKSKEKSDKPTGNNKTDKFKEMVQNFFPLKLDNEDQNEINNDLEEDLEDILKFDWERIEPNVFEKISANPLKTKQVDTVKLKPNQDIVYNELYPKVVKENNKKDSTKEDS